MKVIIGFITFWVVVFAWLFVVPAVDIPAAASTIHRKIDDLTDSVMRHAGVTCKAHLTMEASNVNYEEMTEEQREQQEVEVDEVAEVRDRYDDLIRRFPGYYGSGVTSMLNDDGEETDQTGIVIYVEKEIDQSTLPKGDRIPNCLDGVPVRFEVSGPFEPL